MKDFKDYGHIQIYKTFEKKKYSVNQLQNQTNLNIKPLGLELSHVQTNQLSLSKQHNKNVGSV